MMRRRRGIGLQPAYRANFGTVPIVVQGLRLVAPGEPAEALVIASATVAQADEDAILTPRELEVLALLAEGTSNKAIARRLDISVHTAKFHVGSLLDKLDAVGRTDAVAHAARLGVIHL